VEEVVIKWSVEKEVIMEWWDELLVKFAGE